MSHQICVYLDFLTPEHRARIQAAAAKVNFPVHFFTQEQLADAKKSLSYCDILFTYSFELFQSAPSLSWLTCANAGVEPYCKGEGRLLHPNCILTNSTFYGVSIAEHVVMTLLIMLRRMPEYEEIVRKREWINMLPISSIHGNCFTLLGTGNIGVNVARRLRGMNAAHILGINRSGKSPDPVFDEVVSVDLLDNVLPQSKIFIMAVPGTADTAVILDRKRISLLPQGAYVVNVGRGMSVDQEALMEALNSGHLAGAALDVVDPEPLPQNHPLWDTKNLLLTPHISGKQTLDYTCNAIVDGFCRNLRRFAAGEPLENVVDRDRGY